MASDHAKTRSATPGILYVVATPIGHLGDLSDRARQVLSAVRFIACEDTRHSAILLQRYNITTPVVSFHAHSSPAKVQQLIERLLAGESAAYISDAGTPGISDPGGVLVAAAHMQGIVAVPIPGPSAVIAALSVSGLPAERFRFLGYFPRKKGRETLLHQLPDEEDTVVFYESPFRVLRTLADLRRALGDNRQAFVARELTKQFEELLPGTLAEVTENLKSKTSIKGEFVIVVAGKEWHKRHGVH